MRKDTRGGVIRAAFIIQNSLFCMRHAASVTGFDPAVEHIGRDLVTRGTKLGALWLEWAAASGPKIGQQIDYSHVPLLRLSREPALGQFHIEPAQF